MSRSMGQSGRYPYDNNMDGVKKWNDKLSKGGKRTTDSRPVSGTGVFLAQYVFMQKIHTI